MYHTKRHPMEMDFTVGCDENGILQGLVATIISDTGAYASLGRTGIAESMYTCCRTV